LNSTIFPPIPLETQKAAQAICGRSHLYLTVGDNADALFCKLFPDDPKRREWKSDQALAMLSLLTAFQFIETLPDHLATDALRERLDWKYALHLPLSGIRLETAALCEFRSWLKTSPGVQAFYQLLLQRLSDLTPLHRKQLNSFLPTEVVAYVCQISRLGRIWEAFTQALETLAIYQPEWLLAVSLPHWYECYGHPHRELNLRSGGLELLALARAIGADGNHLLQAASQSREAEFANLTEIARLRQVWREEFEDVDGEMNWREAACTGCAAPAPALAGNNPGVAECNESRAAYIAG
jgi:transposase